METGCLPGLATVTRILIADEHRIIRSAVRALLNAQPTWDVVAEAANGMEAIAKAIETAPNVVVTDYSLPLLNGIEVTRRIRKQLPRTEVLIFTMYESDAVTKALLQAGARGHVLKSDASSHLIAAVRALAAHAPYFTGSVSGTLVRALARRPPRYDGSALTMRECQIVQMIAEGHTDTEAAKLLNISLKTIKTYRAAITRKLDIGSRAELVRYALRNKLVVA
jgi:DNA-binding NarL/FixJ family response regulator